MGCYLRKQERKLFQQRYGISLAEECVLEQARRDFDPKFCELREECRSYLRVMRK